MPQGTLVVDACLIHQYILRGSDQRKWHASGVHAPGLSGTGEARATQKAPISTYPVQVLHHDTRSIHLPTELDAR